jgi:hypothetical protein
MFYDRKQKTGVPSSKRLSKELLANKKTIEVTDFGGSKIFTSNKEKSLGLQ